MDTTHSVILFLLLIFGIAMLIVSTAAEAGAIALARRSLPSANEVGLKGVLRSYVRERQRTLRALRAAVTIASVAITVSVVELINLADISSGSAIVWFMLIAISLSALIISISRTASRILAQSIPGFWDGYALVITAGFQSIFRPIAWTLSAPVSIPLRAAGLLGSAEHLNPAEELVQILEFADDEDLNEQRRMIHSVLELQGQTARELMTPRTDVTAINADNDFDSALQTAVESGFSRIPLYQNSLDEIVGVLYIKDLIQYIGRFHKPNLQEISRNAVFIPETMEADKLLTTLRTGESAHLAIAVDEYGGTAGVITIEDVIEEITGEIVDEFDAAPALPQFEQTDQNSFSIDATVTIDELNDHLGTEVRVDDVDTVGGLVVTTQGRLGEVGDSIEVAWGDDQDQDSTNGLLLMTVSEIEGQRVRRVQVKNIELVNASVATSTEEPASES